MRVAKRVLAWERAPAGSHVDITLLSAAAMRRLNRRATGRRGLTDVLAYALPHPDGSIQGDVYISPDAANFDRGELKSARAQLQWVLERAPSDELRDLARLRLAAVLLDDKAYDEALTLLEAKHAEPMAAQYAALKGDILVAKNQAAEAKAAYKLALEKADRRSDAFRSSVQMRLDALGG